MSSSLNEVYIVSTWFKTLGNSPDKIVIFSDVMDTRDADKNVVNVVDLVLAVVIRLLS